jgi:phage gp36-like protein
LYCTVDDIVTELGQTTTAMLSNDADPESINSDLLESYLTARSEFIDGFLLGRYTLPLQNSHEIIKKVCVDLVVYDLYKRRGSIDDDSKLIKKEAIEILANLQTGKITLDDGDAEDRPRHVSYSEKTSLFSNELLDNYSL